MRSKFEIHEIWQSMFPWIYVSLTHACKQAYHIQFHAQSFLLLLSQSSILFWSRIMHARNQGRSQTFQNGGGGKQGGLRADQDSKWQLFIVPWTKCHFIWGAGGDWVKSSRIPGYAPARHGHKRNAWTCT